MSDWRRMEMAPGDGTPIRIRTAGGHVLIASWRPVDDPDQECGAWHAETEGDHPPCWSDGVCWEINEDMKPSDPPVGWQPLPSPPETENG